MHARAPGAVALCLALVCGAAAPVAAGGETLETTLDHYRAIAARGGWPAIPAGPALAPGARATAVTALRARLALTDGAAGDGADPALYDPSLARAVRGFQRRHGLPGDGVVGDATRAAMNVSVSERIAQLDAARRHAAEPAPRARWIRVNVPAFSLQVLDGTQVVLEMPAVVGRPSRPTPLFEKALSAIVVNPSWTVPPDLAFHDLLPKILADPGYLARRRIDVYESWEPGAGRLDPARIDWKRLGPRIEALTLRQRPGPGNGLGRLMFRMDGEQEIFLHDTPAREVFRQARRDLSSGCIRVGDAEALARAVLDADAAARLATSLARPDTATIALPRPVPVRTVYETAWVDGHGVANFRHDVYAVHAGMPARRDEPEVPRGRHTPAWFGATPSLSASATDPGGSARRRVAAAP